MGDASSFVLAPTTLDQLDIDGVVFPAFVTPPDSDSSKPPLFLAGAGVRGLDIGGKFIKFTAISIYLECSALEALSHKWSAKTPDELAASRDFYSHILNGSFEKFVRVSMILPLTGEQYSEKVSENCIAHWKAMGILTEAEIDAVNKFKELFKPQTFPPGSSILFTHSPSGTLSIAFSKDGSVPETNNVVIENKAICHGILESIIGEHGVSPAAKRSLAIRFCEHLKAQGNTTHDTITNDEEEEEVKEENAIAIMNA